MIAVEALTNKERTSQNERPAYSRQWTFTDVLRCPWHIGKVLLTGAGTGSVSPLDLSCQMSDAFSSRDNSAVGPLLRPNVFHRLYSGVYLERLARYVRLWRESAAGAARVVVWNSPCG